jgi:hypothetical protein
MSSVIDTTAASFSSSIPSASSSMVPERQSARDAPSEFYSHTTPVVPVIPAYKTAFVLVAPREISGKVDLFRRFHDKVCSLCPYIDDSLN